MPLKNVFVIREAIDWSTPRSSAFSPKEQQLIDFLKNAILKRCGSWVGKIVLFGSRARTDFRDDSDYDVFVFTKKAAPGQEEQLRAVTNLVRDLGVDVDVFYADPDEVVEPSKDDPEYIGFHQSTMRDMPTIQIYP